MTKSIRLRTTLSATTILAAGLMLAAAPARAQSLPDTGNVTSVTSGLSGGAPGSTSPTFTQNGWANGPQTLRVDLRDNRTILNWGGSGFDIAAGNTVDFKDARATSGVTGRTDNIAVLNRDLSGGMSRVYGTISSDPNVAVYLINRNGIIFGTQSDMNASAVVNTGAFFASTNDITNDNDFLNGSPNLRFGITGDNGTIELSPNTRIQTAVNGGGTGGRMGDIALISQEIRGPINVNLTATGGDVALVLASDVVVQNAPGSPLSLTIHRGVVGNQRNLRISGSVTGRNVTAASSHIQNGFGANISVGSITATGAAVTDRGVVLTAGSSAPGVTMATAPSAVADAPIGTSGGLSLGQVSSAKGANFQALQDISFFGTLTLPGSVTIGGGTLTGDGFLTASDIRLDLAAISRVRFKTTSGDMIVNLGLGMGGGEFVAADVAGNLVINSQSGVRLGGMYWTGTSFETGTVTAGGALTVVAGDISASSTVRSHGALSLTSTRNAPFSNTLSTTNLISDTGAITLRSSSDMRVHDVAGTRLDLYAAGAIETRKLTGNTVDVVAGRDVRILDDILANGYLNVSGNGVSLGNNIGRTISQSATGAITIDAGTGSIRGDVRLALLANSDGVGGEALTLISSTGLDFDATSLLRAGPARESDIYIRTLNNSLGQSYDMTLGGVQARSLFGAYGTDAFTSGLTRTSRIWFAGPSVFTNSISLDGNAVWVDNLQVTNGDLSLRSRTQAGSVRGPTSASGDILVQSDSASGGISILSTGRLTGTNVVLSSPGTFNNQAGAAAINASGHWVVYASTPTSSQFSNLNSGQTALWNASLATRAPDTISGNRYVFSQQPTLTFSTNNLSKVYGTVLSGATVPFTVSGYQPGVPGAFLADTAATAYSGSPLIQSAGYAERASVAGGPYAQTIGLGTLQGLSGYAIAIAPSTGRVTVTPKAVTNNFTVNSKIYDGTTNATGTVSLDGVLAGDIVGTTGTRFNFSDRHAGVGKRVIISGTMLNGADSGNYSLVSPPVTSMFAEIFKKAITATALIDNKTYDGTTAGTGSLTLNGAFPIDMLGTAGSVFTFSDKNAGTGKTVSITGTTLTGPGSGNYTLTIPTSALADILKKAITGSIFADNKIYDGSTAATGTVSLNGVIVGDTVDTTGSVFTFADKNAGAGKTVNVTGTALSGADAGNYTLTVPAGVLADILKKSLIATVSANGKTYDGTTTATGSVSLNGVVAGDDVGATGSIFIFADKNAGSGKAVNITGTALSGADAGNYTLTIPASALADILRKSLTATGSVNGKTYDGTTAATGSVSLDGVVSGDSVSTDGITFTFADKNAGTGKTVAVGGDLSGTDAGNYTVSLPATMLADILKKAIVGSITADSKTYDGTTAATGTVALDGVVAGDAVGTTGSVFTFTDKNAGAGKTINIAGTTLTGADAGNYTLTIPASALADILKKALTATVSADGRTYDGTAAATGSVSLNGVVAGDDIGTTGSAFTFADKNAGTGKTVNVTGTALSGADAGNYTLTIPASALADILKKSLTATVSANGKTYDGTTAATGSVSLDGVVSGDSVSTGGITFTFTDRNAGTGKAVAVGGSLSGTDAANYTVSLPASVLADILKKSLTATVTANGKTYDGTTAATGSVSLDGVVSGDSVSTGGITFTFADRKAGTGKTVAFGGSLSGTDAANYTVSLPATVLADIHKKALTATVSANGKTYDGTTTATGSVALNGIVAGDTVGTTGSAFVFADKNAGTGKVVNVTGTTLSGTDSGNYTLTIPATVLADIAKRALSVSADGKEKYTGEADPALTYTVTLGSLISGDQLTGALTRAAGEAPGDYAIGQGSLSTGGNYSITFTPGTLTITVNPATNQPQTLRAVPLPSSIQTPPSSTGSGVSIGANALCGEDTSCAGS